MIIVKWLDDLKINTTTIKLNDHSGYEIKTKCSHEENYKVQIFIEIQSNHGDVEVTNSKKEAEDD